MDSKTWLHHMADALETASSKDALIRHSNGMLEDHTVIEISTKLAREMATNMRLAASELEKFQ